jgi:hypothetical protein
MNVTAMPASVDSIAARGVHFRSHATSQAPPPSMIPDPSAATTPARHAASDASATDAPAFAAPIFTGSITKNT